LQKSRMAEEAHLAEIDQLTAELTEATRFQEAYYAIYDEVGSLIARNALAEEEAQQLSKFNAEILGHGNPAQRIMYVDRIRTELAETKQQLIATRRHYEGAVADCGELHNELAMYKSVLVTDEKKPRTHITRVARVPLLAQSLNVDGELGNPRLADGEGKQGRQVLESIPGDMTVDELI